MILRNSGKCTDVINVCLVDVLGLDSDMWVHCGRSVHPTRFDEGYRVISVHAWQQTDLQSAMLLPCMLCMIAPDLYMQIANLYKHQ